MYASERSMALEAGDACHQVFAAVRLVKLAAESKSEALVHHHGMRLFTRDRWSRMLEGYTELPDDKASMLNFALRTLETSGYEDNPNDKFRTYSNLEEALIAYVDRQDMSARPIWIRDAGDDKSDVGIEIGFELVIEFTTHAGVVHKYRFIGKMDGISHRSLTKPELVVEENKTGRRIDDTWATSIDLSHQVTGYCLAASVFTGASCSRALALGLQIPLPKRFDAGVVEHISPRESHMFASWLAWFWHTTQIYERYRSSPATAPHYTHSCNRYFRSCSLVPLCSAPEEERQDILDQMDTRVWNPLADVEVAHD